MTIQELIISEVRYWIAFIKSKLGLQDWRYAIRPYWIYRATDKDNNHIGDH
jgi:hypothetical protein